ncbi:MAG: 30S ribosomal protein S17 [Solirubrobacterales bacterium]|nr:30S ribosomal protein S17 [Solirubrobacterales bacterium]
MAEEEKDQNEETEAPAEEQDAAEAAEEQPAPEAAEEQDAPEAAEEEPTAEADEAADDAGAAAPAADGGDEEPAERPSPKEIRRRRRSTFSGEPGPELSAEERAERRQAERRRKAASRSRYRKGRGAKLAQEAGKGSGAGTPPAEPEPGNPKVRQGIVVSDKMDKTITVRVESARRHPAYEKVIRSSKMYHAHDERNEAGEGDTVRLVETRPMSKTKHWRLTEILEKAK